MINVDTKQRIKVIGIFLLQSYKVITGTMLSIFIPQNCGGELCTLYENYNNTELYHKTLFYFNSVSLLLFLCSYVIELKREEWCVKYLDIDNDYPDNSLKEIIVQEVNLDNYMDKVNRLYYRVLLLTTFIYSINIAMTIKMIDNKYHSSSTISCFISFTMLVIMKLYNSISVAYISISSDKMTSAYMSEFVSFNVLDSDYVKDKYNGMKNNRLENIIDLSSDKIELEEIIPIVKSSDETLIIGSDTESSNSEENPQVNKEIKDLQF